MKRNEIKNATGTPRASACVSVC